MTSPRILERFLARHCLWLMGLMNSCASIVVSMSLNKSNLLHTHTHTSLECQAISFSSTKAIIILKKEERIISLITGYKSRWRVHESVVGLVNDRKCKHDARYTCRSMLIWALIDCLSINKRGLHHHWNNYNCSMNVLTCHIGKTNYRN